MIQPWLHLAAHRSDYRIFQRQTVVEIVRGVFSRYGWPCEMRLRARYPDLVYQVQYGETDFSFAQRLMQEHGIYWFFEHTNGTHLLVLADDPSAHYPSPFIRHGALPFHAYESSTHQEYVNTFRVSDRIHSTNWTSGNFNFETPHTSLDVIAKAGGMQDRDGLQHYDWPGNHPDLEQGHRLAEVRMQEIRARNERFHGCGPLRGVVCGGTFVLERHPHVRANRNYLVVEASFDMRTTADVSGSGECRVNCSFVVQPASTPFRPPCDAPKPRTCGPQTAIVTGPSGHEIWTDQFGRVKLKFHWDRAPVHDDNSSCWIRVATPWAGNQFGSIAVPRVGTEVIVDFEGGDPNRPIIIASVHNAASMPPWPLPHHATQSGTLTRSTPRGHYEMANAIRFEDQAGSEKIWIHAQRDVLTEVECDDTTTVGGARTVTVGGSEKHVVNGAQQTDFNGGHTLTVNGGQTVSINGSQNISVSANMSVAAGAQISLVCGASSIVMDSGGTITITGVNVTVAASGTLVTVAPLTNLKSS